MQPDQNLLLIIDYSLITKLRPDFEISQSELQHVLVHNVWL